MRGLNGVLIHSHRCEEAGKMCMGMWRLGTGYGGAGGAVPGEEGTMPAYITNANEKQWAAASASAKGYEKKGHL